MKVLLQALRQIISEVATLKQTQKTTATKSKKEECMLEERRRKTPLSIILKQFQVTGLEKEGFLAIFLLNGHLLIPEQCIGLL